MSAATISNITFNDFNFFYFFLFYDLFDFCGETAFGVELITRHQRRLRFVVPVQ